MGTAFAKVDAEEAELEKVLNAWRDVPDLPTTGICEAAQLNPFTFDEAAPLLPDEPTVFQAFRQEIRSEVRGQHAFPWLQVVGALVVGVLAVGLATAGVPIALGAPSHLVLWTVIVIPGVGLPAAIMVKALAAREAAVERELGKLLDERWGPHWREVTSVRLREVRAWEDRRDVAQDTHEVADAERATWARRLVEGDPVAVAESVASSLSEVSFPFKLLCRVDVPDAVTACVLLDLPKVEDLLPETRTQVLKGGTTRVVKRAKGDRMRDYAGLACGLAFFVARATFEAGPALQTVIIAAYTQQRQRKSEDIINNFVYEVSILREVSAALDYEEFDAVVELQKRPGRIELSASGDFGQIPAPAWMKG